MTASNPGPLNGFKVLDLTQNMAGPFATMTLADQGADVVKVEPLTGDPLRAIGSGRDGVSAYFASLNRGKRSVAIDVRSTDGRALVRRLADGADVVIQNFRHGVATRLELDAAALRPEHPTLVYVSISGFGSSGPLSGEPAYDHVVQALSGMTAIQAAPGGLPEMVRNGVVDKTVGHVAAQAVTSALLQRARTGEGCEVEISMLDVALSFLWPDGMMDKTCLDPVDELPTIKRTFRLTPTKDGFIALVTLTDAQWNGLVTAFPEPTDAAGDLSSIAQRMRNAGDVMRRIRATMATLTTDEVLERLKRNDVPCAPALDVDEAIHHPQVVARRSVVEIEHPVLGRILQPTPPARFSTPTAPTGSSPSLGEHTDIVLSEIGCSAEDVATLRAAGIIA
jgi:crotonobetainyl-CoA:carnitine CoA-transferase CaiB-like acyl-CoA transferase